MRHHEQRCHRAAAAFAAVALLFVSSSSLGQTRPGTTAPTEPERQRCRVLFEEGIAAFRAAKNEQARETLTEAWNACPSYDVAGALGQVELVLRRYRDAAEHLHYAVRQFPIGENRDLLAKIEDGLAQAKKHVGTVRITVDREGAEVLVDGQVIGTAPLERDVFVEPGARTVQARQNGSSAEQKLEAAAGQRHEVELTLAPAADASSETGAATIPSDVSPPPARAGSSGPNPAVALIGGAVFLAAAGTAVGFTLAAESSADEAKTLGHRHGPSGCFNAATAPTSCGEQADAIERHDTQRDIALISVIVAGVAGAATAAYWFWPRSTSSERAPAASRVRVGGALHGSGAQVWFSSDWL